MAVSPIGDDGVAGPARQTCGTAPNAHSIQTDPANRFAFAACLGGDVVQAFAFDAETGSLEPRPEPAWRTRAGAGPRHFAFHPGGRFVYLLNELDATVDALEHHADAARFGHVQTIASMPPGVVGKPWAADIHFSPDGRFLYTSERRSSTLAAFAVDPKGGWLTLRRPGADRRRAARLRHRSVRALAARRRPGVASAARPCDRCATAARSPSTPSTKSAATRTGSRSSPWTESAVR